MATEHILALLIQERDKLTQAIAALSGPTKRRGRRPKVQDDPTMPDWVKPATKKKATRKKRNFSPEQRAAAAARMKALWAKKKRAAKKAAA
jgi:hypothetical protein